MAKWHQVGTTALRWQYDRKHPAQLLEGPKVENRIDDLAS
jgi:hypothetical protein